MKNISASLIKIRKSYKVEMPPKELYLLTNSSWGGDFKESLIKYFCAEQLQREGILPRGTMSYLTSRVGNILIIHEQHILNLDESMPQLIVSHDVLPIGAIQLQEIAITNDAGIHTIAEVTEVEVTEQVTFNIVHQQSHMLKANASYSWPRAIIVPIQVFDMANVLEELFVRNVNEQELVQLFKRISGKVSMQLDDTKIAESRYIVQIQLDEKVFYLNEKQLIYGEEIIDLERPLHEVFKWIERQMLGEIFR